MRSWWVPLSVGFLFNVVMHVCGLKFDDWRMWVVGGLVVVCYLLGVLDRGLFEREEVLEEV